MLVHIVRNPLIFAKSSICREFKFLLKPWQAEKLSVALLDILVFDVNGSGGFYQIVPGCHGNAGRDVFRKRDRILGNRRKLKMRMHGTKVRSVSPAAFIEIQHKQGCDGAWKRGKPYFTFAMNSRLQRHNEDGAKVRELIFMIQVPSHTVIFLQRDMPGDAKSKSAKRTIPSDLRRRSCRKPLGLRPYLHLQQNHFSPDGMVWTLDPHDDPN